MWLSLCLAGLWRPWRLRCRSGTGKAQEEVGSLVRKAEASLSPFTKPARNKLQGLQEASKKDCPTTSQGRLESWMPSGSCSRCFSRRRCSLTWERIVRMDVRTSRPKTRQSRSCYLTFPMTSFLNLTSQGSRWCSPTFSGTSPRPPKDTLEEALTPSPLQGPDAALLGQEP